MYVTNVTIQYVRFIDDFKEIEVQFVILSTSNCREILFRVSDGHIGEKIEFLICLTMGVVPSKGYFQRDP